jgi:hypothetical protein
VIDDEAVILGVDGISDFNALQGIKIEAVKHRPIDLAAFCVAWLVAEGVGFEPTVPLRVRRFSRPVD